MVLSAAIPLPLKSSELAEHWKFLKGHLLISAACTLVIYSGLLSLVAFKYRADLEESLKRSEARTLLLAVPLSPPPLAPLRRCFYAAKLRVVVEGGYSHLGLHPPNFSRLLLKVYTFAVFCNTTRNGAGRGGARGGGLNI